MSDYEIEWWKNWLEADLLDRRDLVEKLPFVKEVISISKTKMSNKIKVFSISTMLNAFFEDLESAMITKQRLEEKK